MYSPLPDYLTIDKSPISGQGIFATEDIRKGMVLGITHYERGDATPHGVIRTPLGGFGNHSEVPNCIKKISSGAPGHRFWFIEADRDIKKGEEITWLYTLYDPE